MHQPIRGFLVCLLLFGSLVSCTEKTPQATETPNTPQASVTTPSPSPLASAPSPVADQNSWKVLQGQGVTLSLPTIYEGGNPSTDSDRIAEKLKPISPDYATRIEGLKSNAGAIALIAFDPSTAKSGFMTNVNVAKQEVPPGTSVEQFLEAATEQLTGQYQIVEQKVVPLDLYEAGRIVTEATIGTTPVKQVFYTVKNGDHFWLVTYSTTAADFNQRLPTFEQSIRSFKVNT